MITTCLMFAALVVTTVDPDVNAAENAVRLGQYQEALSYLTRALSRPLPRADQLRANELDAVTRGAFGDAPGSIAAFRRALSIDSRYAPTRGLSPKIRMFYEEAYRLGPLHSVVPPAHAEPITSAEVFKPTEPPVATAAIQPAQESIWRNKWFWIGAGVVVAGIGTAGYLVLGPRVPHANLGTVELR